MALPVELTLDDYWRILKRRRWLIFFSFLTTVVLTGLVTLSQKPVYSSFATVKIEPPAGSTGPGSPFANWDPYQSVNTEMRVIQSAAVGESALRSLGRLTDKTPGPQVGGMIADLVGHCSVGRIGDTTLVNVTCEAYDPDEAAVRAQALTDAYMGQDIERRQRENQQALDNINRRRAQIESILHGLEDQKRQVREENPEGAIAADQLAMQLFSLESQKKVLLEKYTAAHPEVVQVNTQIQTIQDQLRQLPKEALEVTRIDRDIHVNESLYEDLARQFEERRVAVASVVSLASLVSKAVPNRIPIRPDRKANMVFGATLGLVLGMVLVFLAENLDTSLVTVEEVEKLLDLPVLGLIPHIPLPDKKEGPNFKAWLPLMVRHEPIADLRKRMVIYQPPHAPVVEAYHSLRASLESVLPKGGGHAIVFTSSGIAEGKTLSCMNFGLSAVQSGAKVLLLEVDLRRPSLHRMLGVPNDVGLTNVLIEGLPMEKAMKGAADFMIGTARVELLLRYQGVENLTLLSSGSIKVNPTDLFKRPEFDAMLAKLRESYDWVLLDCPPLLLFADGLVVGPKTDGVVMFYQVGRMARSALKRAKDELVTVKARPLGIVLNDVRPKELEPRYGYYRYNYYYQYYQQEEQEKKA